MSSLGVTKKRQKSKSRARHSKLNKNSKLIKEETKSMAGSPRMKIKTNEERKRRESREICGKHGGNIVAFENSSGRTL